MKPDRAEILARLREILLSADRELKDKLTLAGEDTELLKDLGLNSVGLLFVSVLIENEFGISMENVDVWSIKTVGDAIDVIQERIK